MVRCFKDPNVVHVDGDVDPIRDIEIINLELILSDLETIEKRIERVKRQAKSGDKQLIAELSILERLKKALEQNQPARSVDFTPEEQQIAKNVFLLTSKPVIYVANISEDDLITGGENEYVTKVREYAAKEGAEVVTISAKIEAELSELSDEEKLDLLAEYGLSEPGLNMLIKSGYRLLGLITYFTAGEKEVHAWTIKDGTKAPQAAGKIHTDFERGFIRAETVAYDDLKACGSQQAAKEKGLVRSEGKDYVVKDGDVILFRFNV